MEEFVRNMIPLTTLVESFMSLVCLGYLLGAYRAQGPEKRAKRLIIAVATGFISISAKLLILKYTLTP